MIAAIEESVACSPSVLPRVARQFSVRMGPGDGASEAFVDIALPDELRAAVPKRQLQFRAGRFCALKALDALQPGRLVRALFRASNGAPLWPHGVIGSITHTDRFASAAVARTDEALALGIDSEAIMSEDRARRVMLAVAWPSEVAHARAAGCTRLEALTLVFSAKETLFKCLHPLVGRMFGFHDVRIVGVDAAAGAFYARPAAGLSVRFHAGTSLEGRFAFDGDHMHTGMLIRAAEA